ncbi:MAG: hypothetical protein ACLFPJ_00620 [Candidatus Woesearchaeota archaeon]
MIKKRNFYLLIFLFIIVFAVKLYFALNVPYLSDEKSYFVLRQAEYIKDNGFVKYEDELSYGGREYFFLPLMHYIIAFFLFFFEPMCAIKIFTNFFSSLLIFPIFLIVKQITKNENVALLSSFLASFIPIYIYETINTASIYSIIVPLSVYLMYFFLKINIKKKPMLFIFLLLIFIFTSPFVIIILLGIIFYFIISWIEKFKIQKAEIELLVFSIFLTGFTYLIFYKDALIMHGPSIIYGNIPKEFLIKYFNDINLNTILIGLGILPLIGLIAIAYIFLTNKKKKTFFLPFAILCACSILLILKLIPFTLGLIYLGVLFVILFGEGFVYIINYFKKTKFSKFIFIFYFLLLILFLFTSIIPSFLMIKDALDNSTEKEIINGFKKIQNETNENFTIIWDIEKGHLINYFANKKNFADTNYLFVEDLDIRLNDIKTLYTSAIITKAIKIMQKYNAKYLVFDETIKSRYNITKISYINDDCFSEFYIKNQIKIYKRECNLV